MITKTGSDAINLGYVDSVLAAHGAARGGESRWFPTAEFQTDRLAETLKRSWMPLAGMATGYGAGALAKLPTVGRLGLGSVGALTGLAAQNEGGMRKALSKRGIHPHDNVLKAAFGYKKIDPEVLDKYLPNNSHLKTAGVFNPYDLDVQNADYLDPDEVKKILRRRMVNKSQDKPTSWTNALLGGSIPGAVIGGLSMRSIPGALAGTGLGALTGAAVKFNDDSARKQSIRDLKRFDASLGTQKAFTAQAMANARLNRDIEAQRRALAMNDADREFHQNTFGSQQFRRVV